MNEVSFQAVLPIESETESTLSEFIACLSSAEAEANSNIPASHLMLFLNDTEITNMALQLATKIHAYQKDLEQNNESVDTAKAESLQAQANQLWEHIQTRHTEAIHQVREFTQLQTRNYYSSDIVAPKSIAAIAFYLLTGVEVTS